MTTERKKAVLFLSLTLVIGIFIGMLVPSFFGRMRFGGMKERRMEQRGENRDRKAGFEKMIYRITKPDSAQKKLIKPILDKNSAKIEALEKQSNANMTSIMDSLKLQLQPILNAEQMKRLDDFSQKNRNRRRGH